MSRPKIVIQPNPAIEELRAVKQRQKQRIAQGIPVKVTNEILYKMLSDALENQVRIMNFLERGKFSG